MFLTNIGYNFTIHYCNDAIASISLNTQIEELCTPVATSCCALEKKHNKCCSDKVVKIDKKTDHVVSKSFKINFESIVFFENNLFKISNKQKASSFIDTPSFYCESNAPPFYKLYCRFVLYA
tara:strand:+ start:267 stop:632 length:366 start_codon:yes stop_codon:yes gene_type:complete